jgi:CubicO group peptidase (beta-lactamase class C family)
MFPEMETLDKFSKRLSTLPLAFEPGTHWWYGFNHEILGFLIERISGKTLDIFLKEQIFEKLGMIDTDFYVPKEKWKRLTRVYTKNPDNKLVEEKGAINEGFKNKIQFLSGGGGLVSTLRDYLKFCLMMLNGGQYEGVRIISEDTIGLMTSNQLPNNNTYLNMQYIEYKDSESIKRNTGYGFGLGVIVKVEENMTKAGIGEYGWGGAADTIFKIDPEKRIITIVLSQHIPQDSNWIQPMIDNYTKIRALVYGALGV